MDARPTPPASDIDLHPEWLAALADVFVTDAMQRLKAFLRERQRQGAVIYPPGRLMFNAFNTTPLSQVKVVILGQDPYHGPGQAHGLSFSVQPGVAVPPSLKNIFKAIENDLGHPPPGHGHLMAWARQGVLLLNTVLSVEHGQAGAHQNKGWEVFTDRVIEVVNRDRPAVVFMLWGRHAQQKGQGIDTDKHLVLEAAHPSPLSAHRGFLTCRHFSKANAWLAARDQSGIDWSLPATA
jgi:uracil-DNA glycosylase